MQFSLYFLLFAGVEGLEPPSAVLETAILTIELHSYFSGTPRLRSESSGFSDQCFYQVSLGTFCISGQIRTVNHAYALSGWNRLVTPMSGYIYSPSREWYNLAFFVTFSSYIVDAISDTNSLKTGDYHPYSGAYRD